MGALLILRLFLCLTVILTLALPSVSSPHNNAYLPAYGNDDSNSCWLSNGDDLIPVRREAYNDGRIFDISQRYMPDVPIWDSSKGIGRFLSLSATMKNGSLSNSSEMKMPTHTGTQVDSPGHVFDHYFDASFDVGTLDLAVLKWSCTASGCSKG